MSSFMESLPNQSFDIMKDNYSEISKLQEDQKFLFYNNGVIKRELNGYWRSIRPYVNVPYFPTVVEFSDKIDNLKEFVDSSFHYFKNHTLHPEGAYSLIAIMKIAKDSLINLAKRYEQEKKPINAKLVEAAYSKVESCMVVIRDRMELKHKSEMHEFLQKLVRDLNFKYTKRDEVLSDLMKELNNNESIKRIIESTDSSLQEVRNFFVLTRPYLVSSERFYCLCEVLLGVYSANGKQFLANMKVLSEKIDEYRKDSEPREIIMLVRTLIRNLGICSLKFNLDTDNTFNVEALVTPS